MASMIAPRRDADVAIIGLGVIGGSAALRLQARGTAHRAFTTGPSDAALARRAGISISDTLDEAVRGVGLVLIAVPLDRICAVAEKVLGAAPAGATILHAGSLQRVDALGLPPEVSARVLGAHPLAGSHRTGFAAARADLFRDSTVYVEERSTKQQREDTEFFWSLAGAGRIEYLAATAHDDAMAWVSHLPQLASTALAATLATTERAPNERPRIPLGPGGRDATRLAMSALEMWRPILDRAPVMTMTALSAFEASVRRLRTALETRDWTAVDALWSAAAARRSAEEGGRE
jgi:prephenate dehydrogenase